MTPKSFLANCYALYYIPKALIHGFEAYGIEFTFYGK
jgi:hypothetical protein